MRKVRPHEQRSIARPKKICQFNAFLSYGQHLFLLVSQIQWADVLYTEIPQQVSISLFFEKIIFRIYGEAVLHSHLGCSSWSASSWTINDSQSRNVIFATGISGRGEKLENFRHWLHFFTLLQFNKIRSEIECIEQWIAEIQRIHLRLLEPLPDPSSSFARRSPRNSFSS